MVVAAALEIDLKRASLFVLLCWLPIAGLAELQIVVIEGLGGEERYTDLFAEQTDAVVDAAAGMTTTDRLQVFRSEEATREAILAFFDVLNGRLAPEDRLAVFMIGHGSFDDHEYKFNLRGPDLTDADLRGLFDAANTQSQLVVNTSSSSGATHDLLTADGRTLILGTRSGAERHATRFGEYFAAALSDPGADVDKNNIVTAAEAFQYAERQVADYYERNGQLATEHPRMEGADAARFGIARLGSQTVVVREDAELQRLVGERDSLNAEIEDLRLRRNDMSPDAYQNELLQNMLELATLEERIEQREADIAE